MLSKYVLYWLKTSKTFPVFVMNRLKETKETKSTETHYVPSQENAADITTRDCSLREFSSDSLYWKRPQWLCSTEDFWLKKLV